MSRTIERLVAATTLFLVAGDGWRAAEPGWSYEFPRDHFLHGEFKTEWWYFTGNLFDSTGRRFGYELTFFREGIRPPSERDELLSRFVVSDLKFAHFTITDVTGKRFLFLEKISRGSFGEAGFDEVDRIAWIENWSFRLNADGTFDLAAEGDGAALHLQLRPETNAVVHGENGVSVKAATPGHASHYYSIPRSQTRGELRLNSSSHAVNGESWFDHEWATNQLAPEQAGWNWLGVQFDDGSALMLYQMRLTNGGVDPASNGTWISADGSSKFLPNATFEMEPVAFWKSKQTGGNYPIAWKVKIPQEQIEFSLRAAVENQELSLPGIIYWEGAIDVSGTRAGQPFSGRGYLELTGYAGALNALNR